MDLRALADAEKVLLIDTENFLKAAIESLTVDSIEVCYLWGHYKRVNKAYTVVTIKLIYSLQKTKEQDEYDTAKRILHDYERDLFKYEAKVNVYLQPRQVEKKVEI